MLVKVEGGQFVKNTKNNALLTVNKSVLHENEARKKLSASLKNKDSEINNLKKQVESITDDVAEIKSLLLQFINREKV